MKKFMVMAIAALGALVSCSSPAEKVHGEKNQNQLNETESAAVEAYIYGYPLVTMDITKRVMTNVTKPEEFRAPVGQFANLKAYPSASMKDVTTPNADTLYSAAWLDLSAGPYVLHVPDEADRYYLMPMLSGWTDVFASPGTRTTGTNAGNFAITGPGWKGVLPLGLLELKSPTNLVWIIGRTYSTGTPEDYNKVHEIQAQYTLTPLNSYGKPYTPPNGLVDSHVDMKTPVRDQVNNLDAGTFFNSLAKLMKNSPPGSDDAPMIAKLKKLGIVPGEDFDINKVDAKIANALKMAPKAALAKIAAHENNAGKVVNGWLFSLKTGDYGTDYLQRAYITMIGLGANKPDDAVYPATHVDSEGKSLTGKNRYVLHFDKGQTPPVKGFWSLTMYNDQLFFVENSLNRYTISPRNELKYNEDGSLDIYIQNVSPGAERESNWLPAPKDNFTLVLRFYWPEESIINGTWKPPAIQKVVGSQEKVVGSR